MREGLTGKFMELPRDEKKSPLCLACSCNVSARAVTLGLMLVLARGVWVKEISRPCVLAETKPYLWIPDPFRPRPEVMFEFAASAVSQGARRGIKRACECTPRSEVSKRKLS